MTDDKPKASTALVVRGAPALAARAAPLAAPTPLTTTIELADAFDDTSLEMNVGGDKFRVASTLQSTIATAAEEATDALAAAGAAQTTADAAASAASDAQADADAAQATANAALSAATVFDPDIEIDPLHWWRATDVTESGGLVDSLNDLGSLAKNFAQVGAARAPLGTDVNGKVYLDLTAADSYLAGVAADWAFLNNGEPFTIAIVYHRPTLLTATETLLQTGAGLSANTGISVSLVYSTAALQGPVCWVQRASGGTSAIGVSHSVPSTVIETLIIQNNGSAQTALTVNGFVQTSPDMVMRRRGREVSRATRSQTHSTANPANALTLAGITTRIYEVVVDNKPWSERQALGWEDYARSRYAIAGL